MTNILIPFGKYKGEPIENVPVGTLRIYLSKGFFDGYPDLKKAVEDFLPPAEEKEAFDPLPYAMRFRESMPAMVHSQNTTYIYHETHYEEITTAELTRQVRHFLITEGTRQNNHIVNNIVPTLQCLNGVYDKGSRSLPFWFCAEEMPPPQNIISFSNGLLDVEAYLDGNTDLTPHTPKWVSTFVSPFPFDPLAQCPLWIEKLNEAYENDQEKIALLQEWFGYCLTADTRQQKALALCGPTRSMKGTIAAVLETLVGMENIVGFDPNVLAGTFGASQLQNKLLAVVEEMELDKFKRRMIIHKLNWIIGDGQVALEHKYEEAESMLLAVRFLILANELPNYGDNAGSWAARLMVIQHNKSFYGKEDRELKSKLLTELSGICNWALEGLRRLRANGKFSETASIRETTKRYQRDNSPMLSFVEECLVVEEEFCPGLTGDFTLSKDPLSVGVKALQQRYAEWCLDNDLIPQDWHVVGKQLGAVLPELKGNYDKKRKVYRGITISTNDNRDNGVENAEDLSRSYRVQVGGSLVEAPADKSAGEGEHRGVVPVAETPTEIDPEKLIFGAVPVGVENAVELKPIIKKAGVPTLKGIDAINSLVRGGRIEMTPDFKTRYYRDNHKEKKI